MWQTSSKLRDVQRVSGNSHQSKLTHVPGHLGVRSGRVKPFACPQMKRRLLL
jgi:hypothetical protein